MLCIERNAEITCILSVQSHKPLVWGEAGRISIKVKPNYQVRLCSDWWFNTMPIAMSYFIFSTN